MGKLKIDIREVIEPLRRILAESSFTSDELEDRIYAASKAKLVTQAIDTDVALIISLCKEHFKRATDV